jgi:hypothetical protein
MEGQTLSHYKVQPGYWMSKTEAQAIADRVVCRKSAEPNRQTENELRPAAFGHSAADSSHAELSCSRCS